MTFPKVRKLYVSYSLVLCATLDSAHGFNGHHLLIALWFLLLTHSVSAPMCELFIHWLCVTHNLECVCSAATNGDSTAGTPLSVSSHLSVIVQWTDQVHADAAWDSHPRTRSRFLTETICQNPYIRLQFAAPTRQTCSSHWWWVQRDPNRSDEDSNRLLRKPINRRL